MVNLPSLRVPDSLLHVGCAAASGCASAALGQIVTAHILPDDAIEVRPVMAAGAIGGAWLAVPSLLAFRFGPPPNDVIRFARDLVTTSAAAATGPAIGALMAQAVGLPLLDPLAALVVGCTGTSAVGAFAGGLMGAALLVRWAT